MNLRNAPRVNATSLVADGVVHSGKVRIARFLWDLFARESAGEQPSSDGRVGVKALQGNATR